MKLWKYGIVCLVVCMLICVSSTASAISVSDPTGDVFYGDASQSTGQTDTKPNIDITQLSATVNGNRMTLSVTVAGTLQISDKVMYMAFVDTTDAEYTIALNGDMRGALCKNKNTQVRKFTNESLTLTSNTLSAVFTLDGSKSLVNFKGLTKEGELALQGDTGDQWYDGVEYVNTEDTTEPNTEDTTETDTNEDTGKDTKDTTGTSQEKNTPGFELLFVIAAVALTAILFRRRR